MGKINFSAFPIKSESKIIGICTLETEVFTIGGKILDGNDGDPWVTFRQSYEKEMPDGKTKTVVTADVEKGLVEAVNEVIKAIGFTNEKFSLHKDEDGSWVYTKIASGNDRSVKGLPSSDAKPKTALAAASQAMKKSKTKTTPKSAEGESAGEVVG